MTATLAPTGTSLRRIVRIVTTFIRLDIVEELSYPVATVFRLLGALVPVVIYYFQATFLGNPSSYAATLVGISTAVALQAALTGFGTRLQWAQDRGQLEAILVEPVPWRLVPAAMNVWTSVIGVVSTALMLLLGAALGADLRLAGVPAFVGILILGVCASHAVGVLSASLLVLAKRAQPVLALYGLAASLLGGALFSIEVLPPWLRLFSYLVPHAYVIAASRTVLLPEPVATGMTLSTAVVALVVFNLVVATAGIYLFGRSLDYARRMGLLSGY